MLLGHLVGKDIARVSVPEENLWAPVTRVSLFDQFWDEIMLIESLDVAWSRQVIPKRHLNAADAGVIVGQIPGPQAQIRVTINSAMLYNDPKSGQPLLGPLRLFTDRKKMPKFRDLNDQHEYVNLAFLCLDPNPAKGGGFLLMRGLMDNYSLRMSLGGGGSNEIGEAISIQFSYSRWYNQADLGISYRVAP